MCLPGLRLALGSDNVHAGEKLSHVALITASTGMLTVRDFLKALTEKGWIEGRNIDFQYGYGNDDAAQLDKAISDAVARKVDVIVAWGTLAPLAAKRATSAIPIVMAGAGDAVRSGLVANLSRPGGNITGYSFVPPAMNEKRLQIIVGVRPGLNRIAVVYNDANPHSAEVSADLKSIAGRYGAKTEPMSINNPRDVEGVFRRAENRGSEALMLVEDPLTNSVLDAVASGAIRSKLPSLGERREFAAAGGLISYGPDLNDSAETVATYVDLILRGRKPADLPVQQPTRFNLVVNTKTARLMDLDLPAELIARADEILD
ncbi:ABC transporter substrate-binding protein [Methylobacterium sp. J-070]|uniref:ABC transporter substrate-binding protein n=1 Tax=Methylobacterium sp. J-070 TaxID=2836650 RepID=UPI001FBBCF01|nr:ABC transporter substrate-binding protein [Methylobacterium sp. J-070]MCJ2052915.1 ABC transporter substrate-binding protein [Methylobacterium sp. J-070]